MPPMSRPEGWSDATHGSSVAPDLERVFAEGKVHRIDIQLAPETYARAWDQVGELVSLPPPIFLIRLLLHNGSLQD